jgi:hypothetical protein
MVSELDVVALNVDVPEHGLIAGDTGTVVFVYNEGEAYEVEFTDFGGRTVALLTLPAAHIREVGPTDRKQARIPQELAV